MPGRKNRSDPVVRHARGTSCKMHAPGSQPLVPSPAELNPSDRADLLGQPVGTTQ